MQQPALNSCCGPGSRVRMMGLKSFKYGPSVRSLLWSFILCLFQTSPLAPHHTSTMVIPTRSTPYQHHDHPHSIEWLHATSHIQTAAVYGCSDVWVPSHDTDLMRFKTICLLGSRSVRTVCFTSLTECFSSWTCCSVSRRCLSSLVLLAGAYVPLVF